MFWETFYTTFYTITIIQSNEPYIEYKSLITGFSSVNTQSLLQTHRNRLKSTTIDSELISQIVVGWKSILTDLQTVSFHIKIIIKIWTEMFSF